MFARGKSKERSSSRKVTPPSPSYMNNEQFASYLAGLRNNRVNRPTGARPPPAPAASTASSRRDSGRVSLGGGRPSFGCQAPSDASSLHQRNHSDIPTASGRPSLAASVSSRYSMMSQTKDYIPDKPVPVKPLKPSEIVPSSTYIERGQRWMEKEEAVSLRQAMEDMDIRDEVTGKAPLADAPEGEEERRIYQAALDEAAELVWQHQNPDKVPQPGGPYRYRPHLRKNSYQHARTASAGLYGNDPVIPTGLARDPMSRSVSGSSVSSDGFGSSRSRTSLAYSRRQSGETPRESLDRVGRQTSTERKAKSYGPIAGGGSYAAHQSHRRRSSLKRNISGEVEKPFSGDQIWEEPESRDQTPLKEVAPRDSSSSVEPLRMKPKNPLNRVQFAPEMAPVADSTPPPPPAKVNKTEIHRNPPSQSRNPQYTSNSPSTSEPSIPPVAVPAQTQDVVPRKQGVEIRSEDIRQATSMRLKDRSAKLPTPSAVSDNPGRPIVSFDRDWKSPEEVAAADKKMMPEESSSSSSTFGRSADGSRSRSPFVSPRVREEQHQQWQQAQAIPTIAVSKASPAPPPSTASPHRNPFSRAAPAAPPSIPIDAAPTPFIPMIAVSDADTLVTAPSIPTIVLPDDPSPSAPSIPVIVTPDDSTNPPPTTITTSARPLPTPQPNGPRTTQRPRGHWSPAPTPPPVNSTRSTALCAECLQPIQGRFVSLSGSPSRFHPQCFRCYVCSTPLEALEISPEPDSHRSARLDRIHRRQRGEILPETRGETMAEDGDARPRFYCHLDWHELFAPRCTHCRTPILGEHVVALGGKHFHHGHFFCAECGDPFGKGETHIEKDGYAWCVACQTKRTERRAPKCKACRGPVVGSYVQALGGEWHDECFRCAGCGGGFGDGQVFPVEGRGVVCTGCRVRELKA